LKKLALAFIILCFSGTARANFGLVQNPVYSACSASSATCAVTVSSTCSNHFLAITALNGSGTAVYLSSVSGGCSGTWQVPTGTQYPGISVQGNGSDAYCLSSTSGVTTINITWSSASPGLSTVQVWEESFTGTSVILDAGPSGGVGTVNNGAANTTQPGVALTLAGSNDLIIQMQSISTANTINSVSTYSNFSSFGANNVATADLENTTSGSAPTWIFSGSATSRGNAIAFTEVVSPAGGFLNPKSKWVGNAAIQ
jgi:hypothetical protein